MLSCENALDSYYKEHIAVKAVDRRRTEYAIDALKPFFTGVPLYDVDIPMCREYTEERGVSDSTVRRELGVLRASAHHARRWRRITLDKMPSIELPAEAPPRKLWLFKDELAAILDCAEKEDERVFRFCQLAYHTGSRKGAIERLRWSQVDLTTRRVTLQGHDMPVTKKLRPIVPVSEAMAGELSTLKSQATSEWFLGAPDPIYKAFVRVARLAGLEEVKSEGMRQAGPVSPHILRHSRATHLLQDGKSPWKVAALLGDSLATVLRVYSHACPSNIADLVE